MSLVSMECDIGIELQVGDWDGVSRMAREVVDPLFVFSTFPSGAGPEFRVWGIWGSGWWV